MPDLRSLFSSPELSPDLIFHRHWRWDLIDREIFKNLNEVAQRQLIAVSLQTQAAMLKTQADGLEKMAGALNQR